MFRELAIDWDLKAHDEPFFNLGELLGRYDLGGLNPDRREQTVEVIAFGVAAIDFKSRVDNTQAKVRLRVADGLLREKVSLGYRVVHAHETRWSAEQFQPLTGALSRRGS